jgi:hypothetical protein
LHASPEWVEGCVEFFVSQHHDKGVSWKCDSPVVRIKWLCRHLIGWNIKT